MKRISSELELINRIKRKPKSRDVVVTIGDDAAVVKGAKGQYLLLTTDMFVEDDHFSLKWWNAWQIGAKAVEANVSDIAAMGGLPKYALVSLVLKRNTSMKFVDELYKGIYSIASKYQIDVIGGDITHGKQIAINVAMVGEVEKKNLCLRSYAKPQDLILVSGPLGNSTAGLNLFLKKKKGLDGIKKFHLEPKAQLKKARELAPFVNAMEDVSDGLATEVRNICLESKVGAVIYANKIPLDDGAIHAACAVGKDATDYALYGGEDFELVFTVSKRNLKNVNGFIVGEITKKRKIILQRNEKKSELKKFGYDHFT